MKIRVLLLVLAANFLWVPISRCQVSFERILDANREPENWLT